MVKKLIEEKNKEFEKKMEMNQLLIDSLIKKNMKKEVLIESQKDKSSFHRSKTDHSKINKRI